MHEYGTSHRDEWTFPQKVGGGMTDFSGGIQNYLRGGAHLLVLKLRSHVKVMLAISTYIQHLHILVQFTGELLDLWFVSTYEL